MYNVNRSWSVRIVLLLALAEVAHGAMSLSLQDCDQMVRESNPAVLAARREVTSADAQKDQAFTHWLPNVGVMAGAFAAKDPLVNYKSSGGNLPVYNGDPSTIGSATQYAYMPSGSMAMMEKMGFAALSVVQPLYMGGRIVNANRLATVGGQVARLQYQSVERSEMLAARKNYYQLQSLAQTRQTLESQRKLLDTLRRDVGMAVRNGFATDRDTLEIALQQATVEKYVTDLDAGISLAEDALCLSLGKQCQKPLTLRDTLGPLQNPIALRKDHAAILGNRDESRLLDKSVEARRLQGELDRGEFRPQVLVGATAFATSDFDARPQENVALFASVALPLTGIWEGYHNSRSESAQLEKTQMDAQATKDRLALQMDKAWNDLDAAWRGVGLGQMRVERLRILLEDERLRYARGVGKVSDLVSAQAKLQEAEEQKTQASREYVQARDIYLDVTGRWPVENH